jgi:peptidoglycan/xylan/chitin deacetylase (PgdA/CDA1 family)
LIAEFLLSMASPAAAGGRLSILIFHRVLARPDPLFPEIPDAAAFDALMSHVRRRFNVVRLADGVARLADGTLPARALAVTFDDGYADNRSIAAPILRRHGVPATVFVATAFLDGGCMWNDRVIEACRLTVLADLDLDAWGLGRHSMPDIRARREIIDRLLQRLKYEPLDRRESISRAIAEAAGVAVPSDLMLSCNELRDLPGNGIDIGAHTRAHPILAESSDADAWEEIDGGRRDLARILGTPPALFAYPNGAPETDYGTRHVRMVREAGFAAAVSTAPGAATATSDRFQLPRFTPWRRAPTAFDAMMWRNLRQGDERRCATEA